jgi:hypothetical protein
MTTRWKGNFINFSIDLYFDICSVLYREKSTKKRQQGDDENKKEEMAMTTLKRRRPLTPLSIHDQIQKFRSIGKSRKKSKSTYMEMSGEDHEKTTKDGNTSMDLLFSEHKCL